MGVDYSTGTGYGFIVSNKKLKAIDREAYEEYGAFEVLGDFLKGYPGLRVENGGNAWDGTNLKTAVVVNSTYTGYGNGYAFGIWHLKKPRLTAPELLELNRAYDLVGKGKIGHLIVSHCF